MRLDECYRILDLPEGASQDEVKRTYRHLTKVWHPDRFAQDPELQEKAQEKLKKINEAYDMIQSSPGASRARPFAAARQLGGYRNYALVLTFIGLLILFRRPAPGGLIVAALCLVIAIALGAARRSR